MKKCVVTPLNLDKLLPFTPKFMVIEYLLEGRAEHELEDVTLEGNLMNLISQRKANKLHVSSKLYSVFFFLTKNLQKQ